MVTFEFNSILLYIILDTFYLYHKYTSEKYLILLFEMYVHSRNVEVIKLIHVWFCIPLFCFVVLMLMPYISEVLGSPSSQDYLA
jgi:hypothetical protein